MVKKKDKTPNDNPFAAIKLGNRESDPTVREDFGNYLFGDAYQEDPFAESDPGKQAWASTMQGRATIRLFSRGVMGAGLYTLGQVMIAEQLPGYNRTLSLKDLGREVSKTGELGAYTPWKYPLRYIARTCDVVFGKPIKTIVRATISDKQAMKVMDDIAKTNEINVANQSEAVAQVKDVLSDRAIWFRNKKNFGPSGAYGYKGMPEAGFGRSLGDEMVGLTFDFAMGSVGDAWGRNIAQLLDPNTQKPWRDKDGNIDFGHFARATAQSGWRILSKNQGEDWAAALPYAYQCRWQRQAINRAYRGFKLTSDMQQNGGAARLDADGNVIDSYAKAGALDLQLRFTGYNWYTLMFREMYDNIANGMRLWQKSNYSLPEVSITHDPFTSALHGAGFTARYVAKSAIKAFIYMTPAVPFFWMFRTPQTKPWGSGIHIGDTPRESGALTSGPVSPDLPQHQLSRHADQLVNAYDKTIPQGGTAYIRNRPLNNTSFTINDPREVFSRNRTNGILDSVLNPFGRLSYDAGAGLFNQVVDPSMKSLSEKYAKDAAAHVTPAGFEHNSISQLSAQQLKARTLTHTFANASMAYTPYMIAKAETALKWDNDQMDKSIYHFLDGATSFNLGDMKHGLDEIRENIIHPERHGVPNENAPLEAEEENETESKEAQKNGEPKPVVASEGATTDKMTKEMDKQADLIKGNSAAWAHKEQHKQAMQDLLDGRVTIH